MDTIAKRLSDHEAIWLGESTFRAGRKGIDDVVAVLHKVQADVTELVAHHSATIA